MAVCRECKLTDEVMRFCLASRRRLGPGVQVPV